MPIRPCMPPSAQVVAGMSCFPEQQRMGGKKMRKFNVLLGLVLLCLAACQSVPGKVGNLTEQQVAALKEVGFVQDADDWVFSASDKLLFGSNEAELTEEAKQTVYRITHQLMQVGITA